MGGRRMHHTAGNHTETAEAGPTEHPKPLAGNLLIQRFAESSESGFSVLSQKRVIFPQLKMAPFPLRS